MQFSKATLLSILPAVMAAPALDVRQSTIDPSTYRNFGMIAARSTSPIHLQTIGASGQAFYIGKPTATYCPDPPVTDCDTYSNSTQIGCGLKNGQSTSCSMGVNVPGGQQVYVDPTSGALKYTIAHSGAKPDGAFTTGFEYTPEAETGRVGNFNFAAGGATGFFACPVDGEENVWQVIAGLPSVDTSNCLGMSVATAGTNATSWQYA